MRGRRLTQTGARRHGVRWVLAGLLATAMVASCSSGTSGTPDSTVSQPDEADAASTSTSVGATPTTDAPEAGSSLRFGFPDPSIASLDPASYLSTNDWLVGMAVYQGLVGWAPGTHDQVNVLAESIDVSEDGTSIHFTLRQGVEFQGGYGEVTAEDVAFSFERIAGLVGDLESPYAGDFTNMTEVRVLDTYEGEIVFSEPFAPFMTSTLPGLSGAIVSKSAVEELGEEYALSPIGTGPYQVVSAEGSEVVMERFDGYQPAGDLDTGYFDEIVLTHYADDQAVRTALASSEVDYVSVTPAMVSSLGDEYRLDERSSLAFRWIGMNSAHPNLSDVRVRQAIRAAIDVDSILEAVFDGRTTRASAIIPPSMGLGYWADAPLHERDLDLARQLLSEAGAEDLSLVFTTTAGVGSTIFEIVQANLAEVGIELVGDIQDEATYFSAGPEQTAEWQMFQAAFGSQPDPFFSVQWFTCDGIGVYNYMAWCNEEFDRLHQEAVVTVDTGERQAMYEEMQRLWAEDSNSVWLDWPTLWFAGRPDLNPVLTPDGSPILAAFSG